MNYTQMKGNTIELNCIIKVMELGYECSIPYGNGAKYDFIADVDGKLLRIQCKSCTNPINKTTGEPDDAIQISTVSQTTNTQGTTRHKYNKQQIDFFATYYNGKAYLIPVEECSTSKTLRFSPPRGGNKNYNKAEDYEIENFIKPSEILKEEIIKEQKEKVLKEKQRKDILCKECGTSITHYSKSGLCPTCYAKTTRKVDRPTREELKEMIRTESFLSIGNNLGVSDNAVRKWCVNYNLPSKKKDINNYSDEEWEKI